MKFSALKSELKITLIIFTVGILWIIFSDKLLYILSGNAINEYFHYGEIFKGILFVTLMSIGLFSCFKNTIKNSKKV
jgi:Na+-driven multidrug efflux pump